MSKLLLIEDDKEARENIVEFLNYKEFDVLDAPDANTGIRLALEEFPDLIICDIMLPDSDGFQILETLRKNPSTFKTPFIFLTARSAKTDLRRGMNLGADDYLTKPYKQVDLYNSIISKLSKAKTHEKMTEKRIEELCKSIAGSLPHEFRQPLNSILGFVQLMRSEFSNFSRDEIFNILNNVYNSAIDLNSILNNFMYYLKVMELRQARSIEYTGKISSVEGIIKDVSTRISDNYDRTNDLELDILDAEINMSVEHLNKVITELTDNAFKFSDPYTPIKIKTELIPDSFFKISIQNFGRGMSEEEIMQVAAFMQFKRNYYEQQGAGLGLIIVKLISEIYGGELIIDSLMGRSLTAIVSIPVRN